jgi:outer membrane murein-binding lipoprotein Lpp
MIINTPQPQTTRLPTRALAALALGSSLLLAGCAGKPPSEQMAVSKSAVNEAVSAGATEYAAVEMKSAQDKFKQAEQQMHEQHYVEAKRLAEQAEWDARLAERKSQAAKAEKALMDAQLGVEELREESLRSSQQPLNQEQ